MLPGQARLPELLVGERNLRLANVRRRKVPVGFLVQLADNIGRQGLVLGFKVDFEFPAVRFEKIWMRALELELSLSTKFVKSSWPSS